MVDYSGKVYGRNEEVAELLGHFAAGRDVSMQGPRRLGKTFVLDRLVEESPARGWKAVKIELAGCPDVRHALRELCECIGKGRTKLQKVGLWIRQRGGQLANPRVEGAASWQMQVLAQDQQLKFERLLEALNSDTKQRWLLLIDELPIFLKALHDKGQSGVDTAREFMNFISNLRQKNSRVRWMVTGSIGLQPLAAAGSYEGVLAKFQSFGLKTLTTAQAVAYLKDLAADGKLLHRREITDTEANYLIKEVGWLAAYYIDALAQKLKGTPAHDKAEARKRVGEAVAELLKPEECAAFRPWEEHLRKHYPDSDRRIAARVLKALAVAARGRDLDGLLAVAKTPEYTRGALRALLLRLHTEGFVTLHSLDGDSPRCRFRNPLLRRWWQRFQPLAD